MHRSWKPLGLAAVVAGGIAASKPPPHPVTLIIDAPSNMAGGELILRVVGAGQGYANYELEVSSGAPRENHSVQRGRAILRHGAPVTLVAMSLSAVHDGWSARLHVTTSEGISYDEVRTAWEG